MTASSNALQPIYNLPIQYKQGGKITVASDETLTISSLLVRSKLDNLDINIGDYFGDADDTTVSGAVNGLNGLDTGSLGASKVYAVYAIADQAGYNPSGFLLSLNATTPQMPNGVFPSNYNAYVRIGWAVTDSSSDLMPLVVSGEGSVVTYTYDSPVKVLNAGTSTTQAAVDLSALVPAVAGMPAILNCDFVSDAAGKKATICTSGGAIADSRFILNAQVAAVHVIQNYTVPVAIVSSAPKVDYIISAATSSLDLWVAGFTDLLL